MSKVKFDQNAAFKSIVGADREVDNQEAATAPAAAVGGKGRPKLERETKKRISLAVLPSLYEDIQKIAYVERKSVSEIISEFMEQYTAQNADKLKEYEQIKLT